MDKNYALVTGAGSGIGKAITTKMAERGINLLLVALPGEDLEKFSGSLQKEYGIQSDFFEIDLAVKEGPKKVFQWVTEKNYRVFFLVNNAGMAGTALFETSEDKYIDDRILVNIRALTLLSRYFIPELKKHDTSFLLNVSSLSAFYAIPFKALYSSSKAFVLNFSRAIRTELRESSVSVSVLCPNGVFTNHGTYARIAAHGRKGKWTSVPVEKVAESAIDGTLRKRFLIIPGRLNHFLIYISRFIPHRVEQKILYNEFNGEVKVS